MYPSSSSVARTPRFVARITPTTSVKRERAAISAILFSSLPGLFARGRATFALILRHWTHAARVCIPIGRKRRQVNAGVYVRASNSTGLYVYTFPAKPSMNEPKIEYMQRWRRWLGRDNASPLRSSPRLFSFLPRRRTSFLSLSLSPRMQQPRKAHRAHRKKASVNLPRFPPTTTICVAYVCTCSTRWPPKTATK